MLEILMPTIWACFSVYAAWCLTSARHYAPLTQKPNCCGKSTNKSPDATQENGMKYDVETR